MRFASKALSIWSVPITTPAQPHILGEYDNSNKDGAAVSEVERNPRWTAILVSAVNSSV